MWNHDKTGDYVRGERLVESIYDDIPDEEIPPEVMRYIDRVPLPYVYEGIHEPTGKKYIGSRYAAGCSPDDLWTTYFTSSKTVHRVIAEDGSDVFTTRIIQICFEAEEALALEHLLLCEVDASRNPWYFNRHNGGKDFAPDEEAHVKSAVAQKGKVISEETRTRLSMALKGKPAHNKGRPHSAAHCARLSTALKGNQNTKGKTANEETRAKMSAARKGMPSPNKGKTGKPAWNKGKSSSDTTRAKLCEAQSARRAAEKIQRSYLQK
jgi:hypothetical protein